MTAQERLDLGISYLGESRFDEAIKAWSEIHHGDDPKAYARAQLGLGFAYKDQGKLDQAIKTWSKVRHDDDPEVYAQAQLNIGNTYNGLGKSGQAIKAWSKVRHDDDPEVYAQAQLNIGNTYTDHNRVNDAIDAWRKVLREDNPNAYAQAQLNLGNTYYSAGKLQKAIDAWRKVLREDNPKIYAQAQLNLGDVYKNDENLEKAIDAWINVQEDDNPEAYKKAQFRLRGICKDDKVLEPVIAAWKKARQREDSPEAYAQAQLNLGNAYYSAGKLQKAIDEWINVQEDDNPEAYKKAQSRLRELYRKDDKALEPVIAAWKKARQREDSPEAYAQTQLHLGDVYKNDENLEKAIDAWINVQEDDNPEAYEKAQFRLRGICKDDEALELVITAWKEARQHKDNPEIRAEKKLRLGNVYKDKKYFKKAKDAYCKARDHRYYESICSLNIIKCPKKVHKDLNELYKNVTEILKELQIIPEFEPKVAHYSRSSTAFDLLKNDQPSNFRLSTIRGVNDPTEGTVLGNYFQTQNIYENIHTNNTATFISCFTFNHDSLNQFRLYGKENGIEATGVSLVFEKDFFDNQYSHLGFITHLPFINSCPKLKEPKEPKEPDTPSKPKDRQDKPKIEKVSLYRCIYLDPKSGYLTLSHRDKSTFYLQYKEDEFTAKNQWDQYYKEISDKEESVKKHLFRIKKLTQNILNTIHEKGCSDKKKEKILKTVRSILLPLQYLVKHNAFQEEQECRIMYITNIYDEKVHSDWEKQWMYVEYNAYVGYHIDKIYLSPGAEKYHDHFRILLGQKEDDNKNKVRISQNPFRNKE